MTHPLLQPQPLSPAEVADLVERARRSSAGRQVATRRAARTIATGLPAEDIRRAVAYAYRHRVSVRVAAREYNVSHNTVYTWWHRLYPGVSAQPARRGEP